MQVINPNNIKIYNLSAGKALPEWLTERKRRKLQKSDPDIQKRIELLQDFEMPTVSNHVKVSKDGQHIFASGVYKPRMRVYDVNQMSMKFERCTDSEIVNFHILSDDYTKFILLQSDRFIEFHSQQGRYYRTRIPKYGRGLAFHEPSCDLYCYGASPEVYRLNLEQGRFLNSLKTGATEIYCGEFNETHHLFACGTKEGCVECWDPRVRQKVGSLDCAPACLEDSTEVGEVPAITAIKFRDALQFAVGTSTGKIAVYDLRSDKPLLVKDHMYGLPIKDVVFHEPENLVLSIDSRVLKIWERETGKPYTAIEPDTNLNSLTLVPDTGMLFMANEAPKILTYYIPALGPAPRWASFLDSLTEELEENPAPTVYDDYKFVTRTELESLGLSHLVGSNLLRAYMHGYFIDIRLYHKAKTLSEPFAYDEYKKKKIKDIIEEDRTARVKINKLPKVNKQLAEKIMSQEDEMETNSKLKKKAKKTGETNLLKDDRFAKMFSNVDFQVDTESEEFRLLNPLVSKLDKDKAKKEKKRLEASLSKKFEQVEDDEEEGRPSSEESSDDEHTWKEEVKQQHRLLKEEHRERRRQQRMEDKLKPKFYELKEGAQLDSSGKKPMKKRKLEKMSLGERLASEADTGIIKQSGNAIGNMEMTFSLKKKEPDSRKQQESREHRQERKKFRRSAGDITKGRKSQPKFWMGKRVQ